MSRYSLETYFRIYNDQKGTYLQIGLDAETDCCKIVWSEGVETQFETFLADDEVELLVKALQGYLGTRAKP